MCRAIKTLHNFAPPATDEEIRASSLQFVRKLSGFTRPSKANQAAFDRAVDEVARAAHALLDSLVSNAPPRDRAAEAAKAARPLRRSLPRRRRLTGSRRAPCALASSVRPCYLSECLTNAPRSIASSRRWRTRRGAAWWSG